MAHKKCSEINTPLLFLWIFAYKYVRFCSFRRRHLFFCAVKFCNEFKGDLIQDIKYRRKYLKTITLNENDIGEVEMLRTGKILYTSSSEQTRTSKPELDRQVKPQTHKTRTGKAGQALDTFKAVWNMTVLPLKNKHKKTQVVLSINIKSVPLCAL